MRTPKFLPRLLLLVWMCLSLAQPRVLQATPQRTPTANEIYAALNCSHAYQIVRRFANGATWEMCWEPRIGYGYRLNQIIFTPNNGTRRLVLNSLHVGLMFVPYDDDGPRYRDTSLGQSLLPLSADECPNGTLQTNNLLCAMNQPRGYAYLDPISQTQKQAQAMVVQGYFFVANYYYILQFTFNDDGSIEPSVGATGSLQRYTFDADTGWLIRGLFAVNHNHLVFWRMDFDLGGAENDVVEQVTFDVDNANVRTQVITPFVREGAAQNNFNRAQFWRVRDSFMLNANGRSISYEIEPNQTDEYRAGEAFTQNDFYVVQNNADEDLVGNGNDLDNYVNGETLSDPVLWYGVNFHHVPRAEETTRMPAHWQGFVLRPRNLETQTYPRLVYYFPTLFR